MKVKFKTPVIAPLSLFVMAVTQNLVQPCWLLTKKAVKFELITT